MEKRRPRRRQSYRFLMDSRAEHAHTAAEASRQRREAAEKLAKAISERGFVREDYTDAEGRPHARYSLGPENDGTDTSIQTGQETSSIEAETDSNQSQGHGL